MSDARKDGFVPRASRPAYSGPRCEDHVEISDTDFDSIFADDCSQDESDQTWDYMTEILEAGEIEPDEFRRQMLSEGYGEEEIANAISVAMAESAQETAQDVRPNEAPEWLWYGEVNGVDVVTFGRWPNRGAKWRYKWADVQATEHNRPRSSREAFEKIIASLHYDGADENSLTVGEIRRALYTTPPAPAVDVDGADVWEAYLDELDGGTASPQGAIAFAVEHVLALLNGGRDEG